MQVLDSSPEIDTKGLRSLLSSITAQLSESFLERRRRTHSHKTTPIEELQDAIKELTEKEKELSAAVGIALMLLDNNEALQDSILKLKENENFLSGENRFLRMELKNYKGIIEKEAGKYERVAEALAKTEGELIKLNGETQKREPKRMNSNDGLLGFEKFESEMIELKEQYLDELEKLKSKE
jgi:hypothetical protein